MSREIQREVLWKINDQLLRTYGWLQDKHCDEIRENTGW